MKKMKMKIRYMYNDFTGLNPPTISILAYIHTHKSKVHNMVQVSDPSHNLFETLRAHFENICFGRSINLF